MASVWLCSPNVQHLAADLSDGTEHTTAIYPCKAVLDADNCTKRMGHQN